jgi:hypothetical protein
MGFQRLVCIDEDGKVHVDLYDNVEKFMSRNRDVVSILKKDFNYSIVDQLDPLDYEDMFMLDNNSGRFNWGELRRQIRRLNGNTKEGYQIICFEIDYDTFLLGMTEEDFQTVKQSSGSVSRSRRVR